MRSLFENSKDKVINSHIDILDSPPTRLDFLHAVLCQVGMPRKQVKERVFERTNGNSSLLLEAGRIWKKEGWCEQPIPYGTKPRLIMIHLSSEAIRTQSRIVEVGSSVRAFLIALGINTNGGSRGGYTMFYKQMEALAACRMTLGFSDANKLITINTQPITRFEAWIQNDHEQQRVWPGILELGQEFFDTLNNHAVPLDYRALAAIKDSAMALDIYTWLAHRLCRINQTKGIHVSWYNLKNQFGREYNDLRNFKKEFKEALLKAYMVYPHARIEAIEGGLQLLSSPPPIRKTKIVVHKPVGK